MLRARFPVSGLVGRVWELGDNLSAYDASYVALAEALSCPLHTAGARLARGARSHVPDRRRPPLS
jgi:predicted nucleic acid-binding protein